MQLQGNEKFDVCGKEMILSSWDAPSRAWRVHLRRLVAEITESDFDKTRGGCMNSQLLDIERAMNQRIVSLPCANVLLFDSRKKGFRGSTRLKRAPCDAFPIVLNRQQTPASTKQDERFEGSATSVGISRTCMEYRYKYLYLR